jgi:NAD(P)-dependent dehydrogenase (short-subunit alcohol dehydrogenase family)
LRCGVDVTSEISVADAAAKAEKRYGTVDILVNVAGILCRKSFFETEKDSL